VRHAHRYRGAAGEAEGALALALWEAGARAVAEEGSDLVGYFEARVPLPQGGSWEEVDDRDHVAAYFAGLEPVDAGALVVAPTHRGVTLRPGQRVLWLDPGMAFGTGHHETTRLVLEALGALELSGARVLDVGAGSGVLAIAADLLGAAEAVGIDIDPDTLPVARANARRNRSRARFGWGDFGHAAPGAPYDVVVANLTAEAHVDLLAAYAGVVRPGGRLLLSGIVDDRLDLVVAALAPPLALVERRRAGDWWVLEVVREPVNQ
jgi:ribosomal protein L11 methyltransferase